MFDCNYLNFHLEIFMNKKSKTNSAHNVQSKPDTKHITIVGAREHNLKNVDVQIPKDTLTIITGPSGSGKSSLALDVLYAEGKRRYMESLSSYARQFLGITKKAEVDRIDGLCPAIAIEQKTVGSNPRSTVGTTTEISDYLRVLFARIGIIHCSECGLEIHAESAENIVKRIMQTHANTTITIAAPFAQQKKGEFTQQLLQLYEQGYTRFRIDGVVHKFTNQDEIKALKLGKTFKHTIDIYLDNVTVEQSEKSRIAEAVEKAFKLAEGLCKIIIGDQEKLYSCKSMCLRCLQAFPELEPRFFSFNAPIGACATCNGLGFLHMWPWDENDPEYWKTRYPDFFGSKVEQSVCYDCKGKRLHKQALSVFVGGKNIYDIGQLSITEALNFFEQLTLSETAQIIAESLLKEIINRLTFLVDVGLGYLSLNRTSITLSGGEGQRIRLATQIGSALSGVLYVLDEPSIGLHQRDNDRLIATLKALRDQGNTVVVVEHDSDTMLAADYIIDMGPAAGRFGGQVMAVGTPDQLMHNEKSLTGAYLSGKKSIAIPAKRRSAKHFLTIKGANKNNLKNIDVKFPLEVFCCVSGVSGSGKSTLVLDELVTAVQKEFNGYARRGKKREAISEKLAGIEHLDSLVVIDQSPIGRTPRSNPATYLGIFDAIRALFAQLPEAKARGFGVGRFSFNVADGRCFECKGDGTITVSMQFLADVVMTCKVCQGKRYNAETLSIRYKEKNIADVLEMTAQEAVSFFAAHKQIEKRLQLLCDVGLGYLKLGQSSLTLSGGEAQRIKLVDELAKRGNRTLYILDEPTTGLHNDDIAKLLQVLNTLVDKGNSMIVIEHNIDVLRASDYVIDMGPEGGDGGGNVVVSGTPEQVAKSKESHTAVYLRKSL